MNKLSFTIANVERETGLSKDLLRMWERRYGFPAPERDANGDRVYPAEQVERLRKIKRLVITSYSIHYTKLYEQAVIYRKPMWSEKRNMKIR